MITEMGKLAQRIEQNPLVKKAYINDWGRYGNFDLHVVPVSPDRYTTRRLQGIVSKTIKTSAAKLRELFAPDARYDEVYDYDLRRYTKRVTGYSRSYWAFDIDHLTYHRDSNKFT